MTSTEWDLRWSFIQAKITQLKEKRPLNCEEYMNVYTTIYNMCCDRKKHTEYASHLYHMYRQTLEDYITTIVLPTIITSDGVLLLMHLVKMWSDYKLLARVLSHLFSYLDFHFTKRHSRPSLTSVALTCFHDIINHQIKIEALDILIHLIVREFESEPVDGTLVKDGHDALMEMGYQSHLESVQGTLAKDGYNALTETGYQNHLETAFILGVATCLQCRVSNWISAYSCPDYMMKTEQYLNREKDRCSLKILERMRHELLFVHSGKLLEGCSILLRREKTDDLSRMFRLFLQVKTGPLESMSQIFKEHVAAASKVLVEADSAGRCNLQGEEVFLRQVIGLYNKYLAYVSNCFQDHKLFFHGLEPVSGLFRELVIAQGTALVEVQPSVPRLIELHNKHLRYLSNCVQSSSLFHTALQEAFDVICNKRIGGCSSAELMAAYADEILHKDRSKTISNEPVEEGLDNIVKLLGYICDKDLSSQFCRNKLAWRLLSSRNANVDYEMSFLAKLKEQFGSQFTSKMEGMLNDLTLARENQASFNDYLRNNPSRGTAGFTVTVISAGFWPSHKLSDLRLPAEMARCVEAFREFYKAKNKDRKLTFIHSLGYCLLSGNFRSGTIELLATTYQASTLLLFNDSERLSFSEIVLQLNLKNDDIVRVLHSLSCTNYRILNKMPDTKSINPTDYFEFNLEFTDRSRRIKIPHPPAAGERRKVIRDVEKDRKYAIDACLVRIMKSRKVLDCQQLVVQCVEQLSGMFKPDIKNIKNRIEDLIFRDFLARDDDNPNTFKYLA